ncbi:MAG: plasmid recombination protein [Macromonas bipunctata]|nr:plasmid recombination protein [Macromonas bipunctata]
MAGDVAFFAAKTVGMSKVNGRKPCDLMTAARHNLREIQAELGAVGRIHPGRTADNVVMAGPATAQEVQALANRLLGAAGIDPAKMRRDHVQALEIVASLPPAATMDPAVYFARCMAWLEKALPLPVLSAVRHADEGAQHLHILLLPLREGTHVGGKPTGRAELLDLRARFFDKVAGPAGLRRDGAKLRGESKAQAVAAVLDWCETMGLPDANGPLWPVLVDAIQRDPTAAVLALGIDIAACRKGHTKGSRSNPIGIDDGAAPGKFKPIGIEKTQSLSCVGIEHFTTPKPAPDSCPGRAPTPAEPAPAADHQHGGSTLNVEAIGTLAALWNRVGCKLPPWQVHRVPAEPQSKTDQPRAIESLAELWQVVGRRVVHSPSLHHDRLPLAERLQVARAAQEQAIARHGRKATPMTADRTGAGHDAEEWDDGRAVDREHCDDLESWG